MSVEHFESDDIPDGEPTLSAGTGVDDPVCEIVDMTVLTGLEEAQIEGEPDLIVELIDLYLEDAPHRMNAIREVVLTTDGRSLKRAAHRFKGSSASLGVNRLAALCEELEQLDCRDLSAGAGRLLTRLEQEFEQARLFLSAERQRRL